MTDKERLIDFINRLMPDDFECRHISLTFTDDYNAVISLSNDDYDDDD